MATTSPDISFREAPEGLSADASADAHIIVNNQPRMIPPTNYSLSAPDLSARRYGAYTLNPTVPSRPSTGEKQINWGGIMKGVLIVSAVVVAAVVVASVVTPLAASAMTWLSTSPVFGPMIGGLHSAAIWGVHQLAYGTEVVTQLAGHGWAAVAPAASGGTGHFIASEAVKAGIPTLSNGFGLFAGGATLVGGLAAAAPTLVHIHALDPNVSIAALPHDSSVNGDLTSMLAVKKTMALDAATHSNAADAAHHASDLTHHAGEQSDHDRRSRAALSSAHQTSRSWAERPDIAAKAVTNNMSTATPRSASFAEQVDANTAKLNAALADPVR